MKLLSCCILIMMTLAPKIFNGAPATEGNLAPSNGWQTLAPIPNPVGWAGMFAGVLEGRLIAGGGSQFSEKPVWMQGVKAFNDRLYALSDPKGKWELLEVRLPEKNGHAASVAADDAIYIVGGVTAEGSVATGRVLRAKIGGIAVEPLPPLPKPLGYAAAGIAGGRLFVVGGQKTLTDKSASAETWSLKLAMLDEGWRREADLPGPGVFVPSAASDEGGLYIFGGIGFSSEGQLVPSAAAFRFDTERRNWERLPDLPEPRVGAATPCPRLPGGEFLLIGGYAAVFPGALRDHPGFTAQTLLYDPAARRWERGPVLPRAPIGNRDATTDAGPTPMVAAPCAVWRGLAVVVSGEIRAATRTPAVVAWPFTVK